MKLETSKDLLERVRQATGVSWWKLPSVLNASESTVKNWKRGRTTVDKRFAPRIAELLNEPQEYVLLCLEHEREASPELRKIWRRLASLITSKAASILVSGFALLGASALPSQNVARSQPGPDHGAMYILSNCRRWLRRLLPPHPLVIRPAF